MARAQDIVTESRAFARQVRDGLYGLKKLQAEVSALGGGSAVPDGTNNNAGVTSAQVVAVVFTSTDALMTAFQGHETNFAEIL